MVELQPNELRIDLKSAWLNDFLVKCLRIRFYLSGKISFKKVAVKTKLK